MANKVFNEGAFEVLKNGLSGADLRVSWHSSGTTIDTEDDGIATNSDFATSDEFDGPDYPAGGHALTSEAITKDDSGDRAELDAADINAGNQGAGTDAVVGLLVYAFVSTWGDSIPVAWIDDAPALPFTPSGGNVTIAFDSQGLLHLLAGKS